MRPPDDRAGRVRRAGDLGVEQRVDRRGAVVLQRRLVDRVEQGDLGGPEQREVGGDGGGVGQPAGQDRGQLVGEAIEGDGVGWVDRGVERQRVPGDGDAQRGVGGAGRAVELDEDGRRRDVAAGAGVATEGVAQQRATAAEHLQLGTGGGAQLAEGLCRVDVEAGDARTGEGRGAGEEVPGGRVGDGEGHGWRARRPRQPQGDGRQHGGVVGTVGEVDGAVARAAPAGADSGGAVGSAAARRSIQNSSSRDIAGSSSVIAATRPAGGDGTTATPRNTADTSAGAPSSVLSAEMTRSPSAVAMRTPPASRPTTVPGAAPDASAGEWAASTTYAASPRTRRTDPMPLRRRWPRSSARTARADSLAGTPGSSRSAGRSWRMKIARLAGGLRLGAHVAGGERRGDAGERGQRRLVAAGVEREGGLVVGDREVLGGDDLALVDAGRHQVPRDGVLVLTVEDRPRRHVEPGVPRQRPVVEVDRRRHAVQHVVGDHPQVGDAQQDVGRMAVEPGGQLGAGADHGDPLLDGVVPHQRVGRGDEHDLEAVRPGHIGALGDEWLVPDERAAHGARFGSTFEFAQRSSSSSWVIARCGPDAGRPRDHHPDRNDRQKCSYPLLP